MTVVISAPEQVGPWSWRIPYSSDLGGTPIFYVYVNGELFATTEDESIVITLTPDAAAENVIVEVFDSADDEPATYYTGRLTLHWQKSAAVDYYRIDECVSFVWTECARVYDNGGEYFSWRSRFVEDVEEHTFRIVPVGVNQNEGDALALAALMVRYPDAPSLGWAYSSITGKLTFTAT